MLGATNLLNSPIASTSIFSLLLASVPVVAIAQTITGCVVSVGDGDTLRVATGGKTLTVRLACVDSPETSQVPFGKASGERLRQLLPVGHQVTLKVADTYRYGRSVAKVYKNNFSINLALIQEGQTVIYRQYLSACPELKERLLKAEANARSRRLSFWNQASPVLPVDFRRGKRVVLVHQSLLLLGCDRKLIVRLLVILELRLKRRGFLILPLEKTLTNLTQTAIALLVNLCRELPC